MANTPDPVMQVEALVEASGVTTDAHGHVTHTGMQVYLHVLLLSLVVVGLAGAGAMLAPSTHLGTLDFRPAVQLLGGMAGLAAGFALAAHFHALKLRFFLLVGLAFLVEGSADVISGIIQFATEHGAATPVASPEAFISWTYVLGRLLLGVMLLVAATLPRQSERSRETSNELAIVAALGLLAAILMTSIIRCITQPLPIFPHQFISRPLDFLSAVLLFGAFAAFLRKYLRDREMVVWWLLMLIAVSLVGEVMMSFSKRLFDPYYDIGYLYKSIAAIVFLMGVSLHTAEVLRDHHRSQRRVALLNERLRALAVIDDLTELYNRRGFLELAQQELKIANRTGRKLMLVYADLDGMKDINDRFGHTEGDRALCEAAAALRETFRQADIIGRVGGDEFVVLALIATESDQAMLVARLRSTLARHNTTSGRQYPIALSLGLTQYDPKNPCSIEELIARADKRMYEDKRAKQNGGNAPA